jgi:predicted glycogen debranching enzyme
MAATSPSPDRRVVKLPELPSFIQLGREICADLSAAESREWLVTNALGSFAAGTVAGLLTRRYHGLLIAALDPPRKRTLMAAKFDEAASLSGQTFALGANRWAGGALDPQGYSFIESFRLEGAIPAWSYSFANALLEKRIWMQHGANTTYVEYRLIRADAPVDLSIKAFVNYRDFHGATHAGDWQMGVEQLTVNQDSTSYSPRAIGVRVVPFHGATPFFLRSATATCEPAHVWYRNYDLAAERERGLDACEDHLHAATFHVTLRAGESASIVISIEPSASLDSTAALSEERSRAHSLLTQPQSTAAPKKVSVRSGAPASNAAAPDWIQQLFLAADQFLVDPPLPTGIPPAVIAGYPWFGVWSRDTMVALPGLALTTGRGDLARNILRRFATSVNGGMLPNFFPESGDAPEYNTVDAALWYIEAVRQYVAATRDIDLARELFPTLVEIVRSYAEGTRFGIHADPADDLLCSGEPGTQLTWMDARVAGQPVTPRIGKPVEVNALWLNALETINDIAKKLDKPDTEFTDLAKRARAGFKRFWNASSGYCFDVLDAPGEKGGPQTNDATLRPNQIFAVSLPVCALTPAQRRAVVNVCAQHLLTPFGLRSLAPTEPGYRGHYGGTQDERAAAYHQGTVWPWLLGPFALAHFRVYRDAAAALHLFDEIAPHLSAAGLGSVSEVFDGDPPFIPRGCPAQAWSVAEILRAWSTINSGAAFPSAK